MAGAELCLYHAFDHLLELRGFECPILALPFLLGEDNSGKVFISLDGIGC